MASGEAAADTSHIPYGWCDFEDVYRHWVRVLDDDAVVVEVGSYLGQSAIVWGHAAKIRQRPIRLICVDPWRGVDERYIKEPEFLREQRRILLEGHGSMRPGFEANVAAYGLSDWVEPREMTSVEAAATFADESVDRVMIDGDHEADSVRADITAWWPKLKPGGEMVGHDDDWESVNLAVRLWARDEQVSVFPLSKRCWRVVKPGGPLSWTVPAAVRRCVVSVCCNERQIGRETVKSLLSVMSLEQVAKARLAHGFDGIGMQWFDAQPGVDTLRECAAIHALRHQYSHVLFLDADMEWPADLLSRILGYHDAGIVSGLYHLKMWPHQPVAFKSKTWNDKTGVYDYDYDNDASLAAEEPPALRPELLIGMGCALIPTKVFELMPRPWFAYQRNAVTGLATVTEDVWFCQQAERHGVPMALDASISCKHDAVRGIDHLDRYRATFDLAHIKAGTTPTLPDEVREQVSA